MAIYGDVRRFYGDAAETLILMGFDGQATQAALYYSTSGPNEQTGRR